VVSSYQKGLLHNGAAVSFLFFWISPAADFAPRRPQRLMASFRGAKSSHKAAAAQNEKGY